MQFLPRSDGGTARCPQILKGFGPVSYRGCALAAREIDSHM